MFLSIHVKNFKSLIDFRIDLSEKKNTPKQLALIYGENGSGKSNIASIFYTLIQTLHTMGFKKSFEDFLANEERMLERRSSSDFKKILNSAFVDLENIIGNSKTIGIKENLVLEFEFLVNGSKGIYSLEFNEERVIEERLEYLIEKNRGLFFRLEEDSKYFSPKMFSSDYLNEIKSHVDRFWGKHTLLSILIFERSEKNKDFLDKNVNFNFQDVLKFLERLMCKVNIGNRGGRGFYPINLPLGGEFIDGEVEVANVDELDLAEKVLGHLFTGLYSDMKNLYYARRETDNQSVKYKLYVKKLIGLEIRDIPFEQESTGTLNILELLSPLLMAMQGSAVVLDEFDAGIHDILIKSIFEKLSGSLKGQLIMTTHNTLLLESDVDNKYIYILAVDVDGNKKINSLDQYDLRVHNNNNRRSQYLKGMYHGVPLVGHVDFDLVVDQLRDIDQHGGSV